MKRIAIAFLALLVLLIGGVLVAPSFVNWDRYKDQGTAAIRQATGYDVRIEGSVSLALLPAPALKVGAMSARPPGMDDAVLSFDSASVRIEFLPLFQGKIIVDSIALDSPRLNLLVLADGQPGWMTPELRALLSPEKPVSGAAASSGEGSGGVSGAVALDSVRIHNGAFLYKNLQEGGEKSLSAIDATIRADSLSGPFTAQGKTSFQNIPVAFDLKLGKGADGPPPIALSAEVPDYGVKAKFSGVVDTNGDTLVQGEVALDVAKPAAAIEKLSGARPSPVPVLSEAWSVGGMLTVSGDRADVKDLTLALGAAKFSGKIAVTGLKKGPAFSADLAAASAIDLEKLLPPQEGSGTGASGSGSGAEGGFLSVRVPPSLPEGQIKISAPELSWKKQSVRNASVVLSRQGDGVSAVFEIGEMPGKASVTGQARLSSSLDLSLKARSQYLDDTLAFLGGDKTSAMAGLFRTASADMSVSVTPDQLSVRNATLVLDQTTVSGAASYQSAGGKGRDVLTVSASVDSVDMDALSGKFGQADAPPQQSAPPAQHGVGDVLRSVQAFSLPFDAVFDLKIAKARYGGKDMNGLALAGRLDGSALVLDKLAVQDVLGADLSASGKVADLSKLSGLDLKLSGGARDVEKLLGGLGLDPSALPRPFGAASLSATATGDSQAIQFALDVGALKGSVKASGAVTGLPDSPGVGALDLLVSHPSFSDVMRLARPGLPRDSALSGPLEAQAKVVREGDLYKAQGITATLGTTTVAGDASLNTAGTRPVFTGKFRTGTIPLGAWLGTGDAHSGASSVVPAGSLSSSSSSAPAGGSGQAAQGGNVRWSRNALDTGWMRAADLDLAIDANGLTYNGWELDKPSFTLTLKDGVLTVPNFESGLFNGKVTLGGKMVSDADPRKPLAVEGKASVANVALSPMVKAFTGALPLDADGNVSMTVDAAAAGVSMAALIFDLNGGGTLNGKDVTLKGVDLARFGNALSDKTKPGDTLKGLWAGASSGGQTQFKTMGGTFKIREGVVQFEKLALDGPQALIETTGTINLPQWNVDLKNHITLRQAAKEGGEPPPPFDIAISGPLDNPGQTFGQGILEDYFQRKIDRKLQGVIQDKAQGKLGKALPSALQGILAPQSGTTSASDGAATGTGTDGSSTGETGAGGTGDSGGSGAAATPSSSGTGQKLKPEEVFQGILNNLAK